jgi:hypothetical protein
MFSAYVIITKHTHTHMRTHTTLLSQVQLHTYTHTHTHTHDRSTSPIASTSAQQCGCSPGYILPPNASACEACPLHTYKSEPGSSTSCTSCPANSSTLQTASIAATSCICNAGYSGAAGGTCSECTAGKYQDTKGQTACKSCPAGTSSPNASTLLTQCTCLLGYTATFNGVKCDACRNATYKNESGIGSCLPCPLHATSPNASTSPLSCVCESDSVGDVGGPCYCKEAYYQNVSAPQKCIKCTPFSTSAVNSMSVEDCKCIQGYGAVTSGTSITCQICAAGKYKSIVNNSECLPCNNGTSSVAGSIDASNCTCLAGFEGSNGGPCTQCLIGFYKSTAGAGSCTACPANSITLATGTQAVAQCLCKEGFFLNASSGQCAPCPEGTYKNVTGGQACTACPTNTSSAVGSINASACDCARGYQGAISSGCTACANGTYKATIGPGTCTNCPSKSTSNVASVSLTSCTCTGGAVGAPGGPCNCGPGLFLKTVSDTCVPCPEFTETATGGTSASACECKPGYTGPGGNVTPPVCDCPYFNPVGRMHAVNWDSVNRALKDAVAEGVQSVSATGDIRVDTQSGNGATVPQTYIYGDVSANIVFPQGWLPPSFTMCTLTRYNGLNRQRIMDALGSNFVHGHWTGKLGICFYGDTFVTSNQGIIADALSWVVVCGKADGVAPNNILVNGVAVGATSKTYNASLAQLAINKGTQSGETSDWAFAHAIVWNRALSDSEMASVSDIMLQSLTNASIDIANPGPCNCTGPKACEICPTGTYKSTYGTAQCAVCPANTSSLPGSRNLSDCKCILGHEAARDGEPCTPCARNQYKDTTGSGMCISCPAESSTGNEVCMYVHVCE